MQWSELPDDSRAERAPGGDVDLDDSGQTHLPELLTDHVGKVRESPALGREKFQERNQLGS